MGILSDLREARRWIQEMRRWGQDIDPDQIKHLLKSQMSDDTPDDMDEEDIHQVGDYLIQLNEISDKIDHIIEQARERQQTIFDEINAHHPMSEHQKGFAEGRIEALGWIIEQLNDLQQKKQNGGS